MHSLEKRLVHQLVRFLRPIAVTHDLFGALGRVTVHDDPAMISFGFVIKPTETSEVYEVLVPSENVVIKVHSDYMELL